MDLGEKKNSRKKKNEGTKEKKNISKKLRSVILQMCKVSLTY
jgi:hypothetical protein